MKNKIFIVAIIIAALLPLFSCSNQSKAEKSGKIDCVREQIKAESMIR